MPPVPAAAAAGEAADCEADNEHHCKGKKVTRIRDCQPVKRRDKEDIVGHHRQAGRSKGGPAAIRRGNDHDREQVRHHDLRVGQECPHKGRRECDRRDECQPRARIRRLHAPGRTGRPGPEPRPLLACDDMDLNAIAVLNKVIDEGPGEQVVQAAPRRSSHDDAGDTPLPREAQQLLAHSPGR